MRRFLNVIAFIGIALVLAVIALQFHVKRTSRSYIHNNIEQITPAYTGIVLGASVRPDKSLSPILQDRVDAALKAYKAGKFQRFLLSGDHGEKNYDEVNAMKTYLNNKGVNDSVIFLDHAGFDTYDSMYRARDIFQVEDAIIFTQEFHLPRAIYLARKLGLEAQGFVSDMRVYQANSRLQRREWLANVKAWSELNIEKQPTYTGDIIPITEDSSRSHDK
ncbi:MAG: ElyC/SanA/YdcF family protein [Nonlabens sp.]